MKAFTACYALTPPPSLYEEYYLTPIKEEVVNEITEALKKKDLSLDKLRKNGQYSSMELATVIISLRFNKKL